MLIQDRFYLNFFLFYLAWKFQKIISSLLPLLCGLFIPGFCCFAKAGEDSGFYCHPPYAKRRIKPLVACQSCRRKLVLGKLWWEMPWAAIENVRHSFCRTQFNSFNDSFTSHDRKRPSVVTFVIYIWVLWNKFGSRLLGKEKRWDFWDSEFVLFWSRPHRPRQRHYKN